ncbi:hypothetical protein [Enterobacter hormaechei]|uniref:hypothetical protein n=1 Tax=Enterobacter hormaechei TaxID=158836 RepID=UPI002B248D9A|nr:hypothetical protein [Enterobacter hormaechei]
MDLSNVASTLNDLVLEKYTNYSRAEKATGLDSMYFSRIKSNPTASNIIRVATACGFNIVFYVGAD